MYVFVWLLVNCPISFDSLCFLHFRCSLFPSSRIQQFRHLFVSCCCTARFAIRRHLLLLDGLLVRPHLLFSATVHPSPQYTRSVVYGHPCRYIALRHFSHFRYQSLGFPVVASDLFSLRLPHFVISCQLLFQNCDSSLFREFGFRYTL